MADPQDKKLHPAGNYNVGYKKPPVEHQFKPSYLRDSAQKTNAWFRIKPELRFFMAKLPTRSLP
jgi:hypothetical protein